MSEVLGQGYGRLLAEAREAKGLTVAQVADKLKLTARQIEAIEAEDAARLPAPVFVRGFVRNYARLVDVPQDGLPVISDTPVQPTETITAHSEEVRLRSSPVRRWLLLPVLVFTLFLVLVALLYAWLSQGEEAYVPAAAPAPAVEAPPAVLPEPTPPADAAAPAPGGEPAPATGVLPSSAAPAVLLPPVPAPSQASAPAPAVPAPAAKPAAVPAPAAAPTPAPTPAAAAPGQVASPSFGAPVFPSFQPAPAPVPAPAGPAHVVQLVAESTDSWIEVVAGDNKRYSRMLRAGEQLTLRGVAPFRLTVGSAAGVRLSYDGKAIDLKPHTGDKVARLNLE